MEAASARFAGEIDASERGLWRAWRDRGDDGARARLLEMHLPYAGVMAALYYRRRRNDTIDFDDYLQLARTALVDAMSRYDPGQGVRFRTFASRRIHGEILDGIERMTEKQEQIAAYQRLMAQRRDEVRALAREASQEATAADRALAFVAEAGLAFAMGWLLEGAGLIAPVEEENRTIHFYESVEIKQLRERIASVVKGLPAQERRVIYGHYYQHQPFEEIAQDMELSRGRVSQIHRSALARLRGSLRPTELTESG
jgi:RNA polymerase sigma factor for flagellar operon FliA